jgi:endonuclease G
MKILRDSIILTLILVFSCKGAVDDDIIVPLTDYLPTGKSNQLVKHKYYTLSYSEPDEQAEWVAYLLTAAMPTREFDRKDDFRPDSIVITGSAALSDYEGSGNDRGHLCPAADMSFSEQAMSETFFMSNMSPQAPSFNRGIWKELEDQVRDWALANDSLYVITGGLLIGNDSVIGANKVTVPKSFYKIILDYRQPEIRMIAFLIPNEKYVTALEGYVVPVDSVEQVTGIDFFPAMPDVLESQLESVSNPQAWLFGGGGTK